MRSHIDTLIVFRAACINRLNSVLVASLAGTSNKTVLNSELANSELIVSAVSIKPRVLIRAR